MGIKREIDDNNKSNEANLKGTTAIAKVLIKMKLGIINLKSYSKLDKCHESVQSMEKQKAAQEQIVAKTENDIKRFENRQEKLMGEIEAEKEKVNKIIIKFQLSSNFLVYGTGIGPRKIAEKD